ncbi:PD40 domain-containing protein [Microbacterium sp. Root180]|uniref:PD40 domain-containing protein n=1 Tax=Microbacterium sp. Root180 TaxID=1736483 RepID=UPI0006F250C2|nr:PD40 domain-containing protein [Microbacterium sp. Root180]KRB36741.1 hypothetical protein ASD93_11935 [Microbacterium sp. Root180]
MGTRATASVSDRGPAGGAGRPAHRRARAALAQVLLAAVTAAGLAAIPAPAAAEVSAVPGVEYVAGADVYLVSRTDRGESGDPSITPDGQRVAYVSTAADLTDGTRPDLPNIFLATASPGSSDPFSGRPLLVSRPDRSLAQVPADGLSVDPVVSADGRYVAFVSLAGNLAPGTQSGDPASIFVRDTVARTTIRLDGGVTPDGSSVRPDISDDGRYVVFESDAVNLSPGDVNGATDVFVADLDADGDGDRGDVAVTRLLPGRSVPGGLSRPAISGDGEWIVYTASVADPAATVPTPTSAGVFRIHRRTGVSEQVLPRASAGAIDANGTVIAARADDCGGSPAIVAAALDEGGRWNVVAVGASSGAADEPAPAVSADGSSIAFAGSPDSGDAGVEAVVRVATPRWPEAVPVGSGCPRGGAAVIVVGPGRTPALSASGRTVALAGQGDMSRADRSVTAIDLHTHDGLSVTNTMRSGAIAHYVTAAEIAGVSSTALLGEAGELARLELGRLQELPTGIGPELGELPLDRLRLGATVLADLPLNVPGLPGGWHTVLPDSPFADDVAEHVTLQSIVDWAGGVDGSAPGGQSAVATAVRSIRLGDIARLGTPAGELSPTSLLLGDVPLADLPIEGAGDPLDDWRAAVRAQRVDLDITGETVLAEADEAGLDLGAIGLEDLGLADIPAASATAGPETTVGEALFSLVAPRDYPWQAFDPSSLPADVPTEVRADDDCTGAACGGSARFRFTFDSGPGEPTRFADAAASVRLPATTAPASILVGETGPESVTVEQPYAGDVQVDGSLVRLPLGDGIAGTTRSVSIAYTASRGLGAWVTSATLTGGGVVARNAVEPAESRTDAEPDAVDDGSPSADPAGAAVLTESSVRYGAVEANGTAVTEGWYRVAPPRPGHRVVVAASAADRGLTVTLLEPSAATTPLGIAARRDAPSRAVPGAPGLSIGSGFGTTVDGYDVVDVAQSAAGGSATVEARWSEVDAGEPWLVRVVSSDAAADEAFYGIHVDYPAEDPLPRCTPWIAPPASGPDEVDGSGTIDPLAPFAPYGSVDPDGSVDPLDPDSNLGAPVALTSDAVTATTNTVFVTDAIRMRDLHGQDGVDEVIAAIRALDGVGEVGDGPVKGAVLTVDGDAGVVAARAVLDADPCSVSARQAVVRAINRYLAAAIGAQREHIAAIVIVGGDDVIPHAPVAQRSETVTEVGHAGALRLAGIGGTSCPAVEAGAIDPCATPQSAAAAGGFLLTDDPYAFADAYPSRGGHVYVPAVGIGRLIDAPDEIRAQLDRFRWAEGVLEGDSLLATGYGPWSDLPEAMSAALSWRTGGSDVILEPRWTTADAEAALSPRDGSDAPAIIALNTVGDERRMISGAAVADGTGEDSALTAEDHRPSPPPAAEERFDPGASTEFQGALALSLGCHSGVHLPESIYGDEPHWAGTFTDAGGFVGSTGCGLADESALGPSERLLALYAGWIGVDGENGPVSAGSALAFAKQSYIASAAQYTEADALALEQTIFYGVPLYTFRDSTRPPPLAEAAALADDGAGVLRLRPSVATVTLTDPTGAARVFLTADGQDPLSVAGQPLVPAVTRTVPAADAAGAAARGVLVTGLNSQWREPVEPAVADPRARMSRSEPSPAAPPSAAALATLTQQGSPDGPLTVVVATAARLSTESAGATRFEVYSDMELELLYGDANDAIAPVITAAVPGSTFRAVAVDPSASGGVARALLLVASAGTGDDVQTWRAVELQPGDGDDWSAAIPTGVGTDYRWVLQVVDDAGNVTTAHSDCE